MFDPKCQEINSKNPPLFLNSSICMNFIKLSRHLMVALLLLTTVNLSLSLKVSVSIPELVKLNDGFWLNCSHQHKLVNNKQSDLGQLLADPQQAEKLNHQSNEEIYSIKWYKDDEEFYSFLPNAEPKVSIYETNGIQLDRTKSYEGNVFLNKADVNTEGLYRCEIVSEAVFETVRKSKYLKVYALPVRGPRIEILDLNGRTKSPKAQEISYAVGDKIILRCNSAPSKPASRLRWYLNDQELQTPTNSSNSSDSRDHKLNSAYDVTVTPIEHRRHFKGIYSSHSMLSLVLHQNDLINNKISFKCLASLREDIAAHSKQLIVLTSTRARLSRAARARRFLADLVASQDSRDHVQHRQRSQHLKHAISRMPQDASPSMRLESDSKSLVTSDFINSIPDDTRNQMFYVYEDSDSTLGPSILDEPKLLDNYIKMLASQQINPPADQNQYHAIEYSKGDNIDYMHSMRERGSRHRSSNKGDSPSLRRLHGTNSLVKSPFYLDESDPLRPIINWPPLESGRFMLLPPGRNIVAIPTQGVNSKRSAQGEQRFVMPPRDDQQDSSYTRDQRSGPLPVEEDLQTLHVMLDLLASNLNCTCTESNSETKLKWLVNDITLGNRDTRIFPTRISPDHKQTWSTVGLQFSPGSTLQTILERYYRDPTMSSSRDGPNQQQMATNEQLRFMCQVVHSMLLYSSSEMITFDFNPPPGLSDGNSIDKLNSLPSNVIQATSASQSSSASSWLGSLSIFHGSQTTALMSLLSTFYIVFGTIQLCT